ncbi:MAG: hypothetical protein PVI91_13590 [Gammaproteobacteria bacterium]
MALANLVTADMNATCSEVLWFQFLTVTRCGGVTGVRWDELGLKAPDLDAAG